MVLSSLRISLKQQKLLLSSNDLIENFLSTEIKNRKKINPWLETMLAYRQENSKNIGLLTTELKDRNFLSAEELIGNLKPDPLTRLMISISEKQYSFIKKNKVRNGYTNRSVNEKKWQNLSVEKFEHLKKLLPRHSLPIFWTWSASKIADEINSQNNRAQNYIPQTNKIFKFQEVCRESVILYASKLKNKRSSGCDGLSSFVLKRIVNI